MCITPSDEDANEDRSASNARLYAELERSLTLCKIAEIELALKQAIDGSKASQTNRRDGENITPYATSRGVGQETGQAASSVSAASLDSATTFEEENARRISQLSEQDKIKIYTDVYGRKPQHERVMDQHRDELEYELRKIPPGRKAALLKAQRAYPLLFCTAAHTDLFLHATGYNPKLTAVRVVNYWEKRLHLFGDRAFSPESFNKPTAENYLRMYNNSMNAVLDTDTDEVTMEIAKGWLKDWRKTKTANLDKALQKIPPNKIEKAALIEAQEKIPNLVSSDNHKLLFLQCVDFHEEAAASRMVKYWSAARNIFGDGAYKKITIKSLKDHSPETRAFIRLLPGMDAYGRNLFYLTHSVLPPEEEDYSPVGYEMILWYVMLAALEVETARSNGAVFIIDHKNAAIYNKQLVTRLTALIGAIPIKIKAIHDLNPTSWWVKHVSLLIDKWCLESCNVNERRVIHVGSDDKILFELQEFGIAKDQLPVEMGGCVDSEYWEAWLRERGDAGK